MAHGAEGFVSSYCGRAVRFLGSTVIADRNDSGGLAVHDGGVEAALVIGSVGGHGADVFVLSDLVQHFRQDRILAISAGGELHRKDVRGDGVHGQMYLAPLTSALNAIVSGLPLTIAQELDPGTVHRRVQQPIGAPVGNLDGQCALPPAQ